MATATHAKPANEPARRLYANVVVPPECRRRQLYAHVVLPPHLRHRTRFDNDSLRTAVYQYVGKDASGRNLRDYTEEALRDAYCRKGGCNYCCTDDRCRECFPESAEEAEQYERDFIWWSLNYIGLEEPVTEEALKRAKDEVIARHGYIEDWDVSNVTDTSELFAHCTFDGDLSKWDVSNVVNMCKMFAHTSDFNGGDLSKWNVSKVTDMFGMFGRARVFNGDLSTWNVSKVTNMRYMFSGANNFNGDLSTWDVSKITDMDSMFSGAHAFNGDLSKWNVSKVTNMNQMFTCAYAFNGDLSKWNVSKVTNMNHMFYNARSFNGDLSKWDMNRRLHDTWCNDTFHGAHSFDGALPPKFLKLVIRRRDTPRYKDKPAPARWLWRLVRHSIRPHVLARLAAYHLMELAARPDAEGNAPRGAIEAFCEDFSEGCPWWSES